MFLLTNGLGVYLPRPRSEPCVTTARLNVMRDGNVQESVSLVLCVLVLLVAPNNAATVQSDIGVTLTQLDTVLIAVVAAGLAWHLLSLFNALWLCSKRCWRARHTSCRRVRSEVSVAVFHPSLSPPRPLNPFSGFGLRVSATRV